MASVRFYGDDSFTEQVFVIAGYAGTSETLDEWFTPRWQAIIEAAPRPISEFKASDCQSKQGEFRDWEDAETIKLTTQLVSLIVEACATKQFIGFGSAIVLPGIIDPAAKNASEGRRRLEHYGFQMALGATLQDALNVSAKYCAQRSLAEIGIVNRKHDVQPVLDRKDGFAQRAIESFDRACEIIGPEVSSYLNPPIPGDSKALPPLQAADLFAFEIKREIHNRCFERPSVRRALDRLVCEGQHRARCMHFAPFDEFMEQIRTNGGVMPTPSIDWLFRTGGPVRAPDLWGC